MTDPQMAALAFHCCKNFVTGPQMAALAFHYCVTDPKMAVLAFFCCKKKHVIKDEQDSTAQHVWMVLQICAD